MHLRINTRVVKLYSLDVLALIDCVLIFLQGYNRCFVGEGVGSVRIS